MKIRTTKEVRIVNYYGHVFTVIVERVKNTVNGGSRYDVTFALVDGRPCGVTVRTEANFRSIDEIVCSCAVYAGVF